jgi:hypothetical protein
LLFEFLNLIQDAIHGLGVQVRLFAFLRVGPVLEADDQLPVFYCQRLFFREDEPAFLTVLGAVVVLFRVRLDQLEVNALSVG